ncbi:pheromone receptor a [Diplocarpon rosae]|nr:pheromone receptor a [Diplocarpon rosae]
MEGYPEPTVVADAANAIALPIFSVLGLLITYLPLRSFYRVKNIAACSIIFVVNVVNLMTLINTLIWPSDDWTTWWLGYGVCDVEVLLRFPITLALITSLCCLSKGLADALDTEHAVFNQTKAQRRRKVIADVLFCWAVPVMQMALHYVVQAGRYMIAPVFGCADQQDNSWPMLVIFSIWGPLFILLNVYYAGLMLVRLRRHRQTISAALTSTGSGLPPRKFVKLVLISMSLIIIYLPVQAVFIWYATPTTLVPYSWARVHNPATWDPILFIHTEDQPTLQWNGWAGIATALMMFLYFGFNDDAVDTYRKWLVYGGAGRIWPSLKMSREQRRGSAGGSATLGSRGSFISHFDLVSKAMKYVDGNMRKNSHATSTTMVGDANASRKGSQGTLENMTALAHTNTATSSIPLKSRTNSTPTGTPSYPIDITSAPAPYDCQPPTHHASSSAVHPTTPPPSRGVLSLFRTHLHLPFGLFASSPSRREHSNIKASTSASTSNEKAHDLECQAQPSPSQTRRTSSVPTHSTTTISTSIWSSPKLSSHFASHSPFHAQLSAATCPESGCPGDEELDPHAPKLGSRAYRERERRELAAERSRGKLREESTQPELGALPKGERSLGGVVKTTTVLERMEESVV